MIDPSLADTLLERARTAYLRLHADADSADAADAASTLSFDTHRALLNWFGHGDYVAIEAFMAGVQALLADIGQAPPLRGVPRHERLAARLADAGRLCRAYLGTDSQARIAAVFSIPRRESWARLVRWAYEHKRPFQASEIPGDWAHRSGPAYVLGQLVDADMLSRHREGKQAYLYTLSPLGRAAARYLIGAQDLEDVAERLRSAEDALRKVLNANQAVLDDLARTKTALAEAQRHIARLESDAQADNASVPLRRPHAKRHASPYYSAYVYGLDSIRPDAIQGVSRVDVREFGLTHEPFAAFLSESTREIDDAVSEQTRKGLLEGLGL